MTSAALLLIFASVSQKFSLPDNLLSSLCYVESKHVIEAIHVDDGNSNSVGICQIKLSTARLLGFRGDEIRLKNPNTNIFYAGKYLRHQLLRYHGDVPKSISAYNAGSCRYNKLGEIKNRKYVAKVMMEWNTR